MLTQEQAADIFDRIRKLSTADEVEVLFSGGHFALTRFANNTMSKNQIGRLSAKSIDLMTDTLSR